MLSKFQNNYSNTVMILSFRTDKADPDQTAPRGASWSASTLSVIPSAPLDTLLYGRATLFKF